MSQLIVERDAFKSKFQKDLDVLKQRIQGNCQAFIKNTASQYYDKSQIETLNKMLNSSSLQWFGNYLRSLSVSNFDSFEKTRFWQIIDAVNFYEDSIGLNWPYMSLCMREQYLKFATDEVQNFRCVAW